MLRSSDLSNSRSNAGSSCFILMNTKTSSKSFRRNGCCFFFRLCSFISVTSHNFGYLQNNRHEFLLCDPSKCSQDLRRNTSQFIPLGCIKDMLWCMFEQVQSYIRVWRWPSALKQHDNALTAYSIEAGKQGFWLQRALSDWDLALLSPVEVPTLIVSITGP